MTSILVVEDEAIIAADIQATLERAGYRVVQIVSTGEEAIRVTRELRPDLVMMDIRLAGPMDGVEAALRVRSERQVPIVFLTAHADDKTLMRARQACPYGYLLKPFNDRELRTTVEIASYKSLHERGLAEQEKWLKAALHTIGEGVIATDSASRVRLLNRVAETLTGWDATDARGHDVAEVFVRAASTSPSSFDVSARTELVSRGGKRVAIEDSTTPIVDDQGTVLGSVIVFRDIEERRELEQRLAAASRLTSIGTLVAGVAHEVNNPLSYAIGNLEFACERMNRSVAPESNELAEAQAAVRDALDGARRVARIVGDLGQFARGASSNADSTETTIALATTIDIALKLSAAEVRHRATVRVDVSDPPLVRANEGRLCQVFVNLITNAARAMPEGRSVEENKIRVSAKATATGEACVEIRDNGRGIAASVLPRIFDPFFTTKGAGVGGGLGLSVSRSIVTAMSGTIDVVSVDGTGSVFRVVLPAARARNSYGVLGRALTPRGTRGTVLVVDDEPAIVRMLARVLAPEHDVATAFGGDDALAFFKCGRRFDAVVCDLMMPGTNGIDVVEQLEREFPEQARRVILLSGGAVTERAKAFVASTRNRLLDKPVGVDILREAVRMVMP
jgi:two-component system, cell cycle sensor histidine kinase and response regulator CckA